MDTAQTPPPPPGVIASLTAGFNLVANRAALFLFPLGLDIFLWLGPRLKIYRLLQPFLQDMQTMLASPDSSGPSADLLRDFWQNFNLFGTLRTFPLGVFSLMSAAGVDSSPLGTRVDWELSSAGVLLLAWLGLTLLGWALGSAYFAWVGRASAGGAAAPVPFSFGLAWLRGFLYAALWNLLALVFSLPLFFFIGLLVWINLGVALLGLSLVFLFGVWLLIPIYFSSYAIFTQGRGLLASMQHGLQVVRFGAPSLAMFSLAAFFLSQGLDFLWRAAPPQSGFALAGLFGHAFVSTGLLAASFFHYQALDGWIVTTQEWLRSNRVMN